MHCAGGYSYPGDERRIPEGLEKEHDGDEDEEMMDEEDEDMEKNYMARSADGINELLKDIKGLLSNRHQEKQQYAEIQNEIGDLKKSVAKDVKDGIRTCL